jgi:protein phosphatase
MTKRTFVDRMRELLQAAPSPDTVAGAGIDVVAAPERRAVEPVAYACGVTDVGRVRTQNEDALYVAGDGRLLVVADGMGGHRAGEVAAALAVEALAAFFDDGRRAAIAEGAETASEALRVAFQSAHERVQRSAAERSDRVGMGTTLVAGYVHGDVLHTCHVGDVRCYAFRDATLLALTHDHSVVGMLVRAGKLGPEEARRHPRRNEVLQAVGLDADVTPDLHQWTLAPGDVVLLCSDGLWEMIGEDEIAEVLGNGRPLGARARELVHRANQAGGRDNVTVVLYEHPVPAP